MYLHPKTQLGGCSCTILRTGHACSLLLQAIASKCLGNHTLAHHTPLKNKNNIIYYESEIEH
jgi:hypothetical protein